MVKGTPWEGHLMEWLNIVVRVMHITFGIAWIGASFYFVFLENALNRKENIRDEIAGDLWAVHGGGFYYLEKYKVAPKTIPKNLHWFKYEAYFTWLSGFGLLFIIYYFNASATHDRYQCAETEFSCSHRYQHRFFYCRLVVI